MLPRADITGTRPVILIEATTPATALGQAKQESLDRLIQLTLGKEYQAQVLSRLADGNFLVKINNAPANMALPPGTKAGDTIDLTLLAVQPRPTFLLGKPDPGATTSLSNAGRLIGNMLQLAQEGGMPTTLVGKTPLVSTPGAPAPQIAGALQNAIAFSGLFYESHVAQWALGARPATDLLREPPAKRVATSLLGTPPPAAEPEETGGGELNRLVNNLRGFVTGERPVQDAQRAASTIRSADLQEAIAPVTGKQQELAGTEAVKLISLQLDTLEQRRVMWQGELFPGQPLEWEISDETPQKNKDQPEPEPVWNSTVRFSLPTLGAVSASIRLVGDKVQIQVNTPSADTASALRTHGELLADALGAAGSPLESLLVKQQDG
jgi:hypothetical protein